MKKVLVITYYWPPGGGAGVQRWLKFVKYLREFNWEPVIYTPENPEYPETDDSLLKDVPDNVCIVRQPIWEPYEAYKKLVGRNKKEKINAAFLSETKKRPGLEAFSVWLRGNFFIPDARAFWIRPSVKFLAGWLREHKTNAIVSTGPPHSMHLIAMELNRRTGIPWLADFRDPWTDIDFYQDLRLHSWADRKHKRLEKAVLRNASRVTVISKGMAAAFGRIYNRRYDVITNGYDESDLPLQGDTFSLDEKFSIAHIGTLVGSRNPLTLWEALRQLITEVPGFADDLEIKLVGKTDYSIQDSLTSSGLRKYVKQSDYMPHDQVTREQRRSRVLLLIINQTPNAAMILTGKFFEYMAAERPILCLGPLEGDAASILRETGTGLIAGFGDTDTMKKHIKLLYQQFKEGNTWHAEGNIHRFTRRNLTRMMTYVMDEMTSGQS